MKVRLSDYTEDWKRMFEEEAEILKTIFGEEIISFEHFGSTSVPGMKAKPVIDMMCIVKDIEIIDTYKDQMISLNYDFAGEWGIKRRRLFRKGEEKRTHHLHFYQFDHPEIERHLVLRDYLLTHPTAANQYSQFKERLAHKYEFTKDYSPAKKAFVSELEKKAIAWYQNKG
ncbi:GrpB family protein [Halobacillus karajensis]|uniref:Dephospho-CoA kinase/protein folding accessory domain-containing protein n=1 Tax=Halobacillus karajensis TaxID=195088 RepID=A0A059NYT9_9BACI|nr:GrpB family protein [Halobacillus karajensis]CDQ18507.1 dephospho-CoA kinase/protein folding accessory domain-containing protein [Halobacillus karajensis]CDQ23421.1 dephospho-CoA kinase/protein folding accessory domain-containing protein [Halobacillus karajensis]CDQ26903.1 dephospho-CoA kinase/protein folding accessory domain-containing protein [Halobacillus karajensis]